MSASDLAIVAAVIFVWGTLSARLERYDVTAPIIDRLHDIAQRGRARPDRQPARTPLRASYRHHRGRT
jgi:hypothetical protein